MMHKKHKPNLFPFIRLPFSILHASLATDSSAYCTNP